MRFLLHLWKVAVSEVMVTVAMVTVAMASKVMVTVARAHEVMARVWVRSLGRGAGNAPEPLCVEAFVSPLSVKRQPAQDP